MNLYQMLYVSGAVGCTADDIAQILISSRRNNGRLGVTGMLLYADGAFLQVLEGEQVVVSKLASRIRKDPRHRNFMVLLEGPAEQRGFGAWEMGFRDLDPSSTRDQPIFAATRAALAQRVGRGGDGSLLHMVMAFGRDFVAS